MGQVLVLGPWSQPVLYSWWYRYSIRVGRRTDIRRLCGDLGVGQVHVLAPWSQPVEYSWWYSYSIRVGRKLISGGQVSDLGLCGLPTTWSGSSIQVGRQLLTGRMWVINDPGPGHVCLLHGSSMRVGKG